MKVEVFEMERMQCTWEREVDYEFSESGFHPLHLNELLEGDDEVKEFLASPLGYPHADGTPKLRSRIAATYGNVTTENVFVTNGSSEANFIAAWSMFEKGD
ncbi:MAG: hypothetical protein MUO84_05345 [Thermoplasmata archaeon]|nr:hypothetical protein [Thermoplasmata archaeon]